MSFHAGRTVLIAVARADHKTPRVNVISIQIEFTL
jgi:hypothetical protein